jgi:DnaJ like chaperone protein
MDFQSQIGPSLGEKCTSRFSKKETFAGNQPRYLKGQVYRQSSTDTLCGEEFNLRSTITIFFVMSLISMIAVAVKKIRGNNTYDHQYYDYQENDTGENYNDYESKTDLHRTPYEILNVSPYATLQDIKSAYRKLATQYHPDKVACLAPEFQELANRIMKEINKAYKTLTQNE